MLNFIDVKKKPTKITLLISMLTKLHLGKNTCQISSNNNIQSNEIFFYIFPGDMIAKLTDIDPGDPDAGRSVGEKTAMVRAARQLLSAITKVLLMADRIVVKQLLAAKDKVRNSCWLLKIR